MIYLDPNATTPVLPEGPRDDAALFGARSKAFIVVLVGADPFPDENGVAEFADGTIAVTDTR
jgi:hypothetical protein